MKPNELLFWLTATEFLKLVCFMSVVVLLIAKEYSLSYIWLVPLIFSILSKEYLGVKK